MGRLLSVIKPDAENAARRGAVRADEDGAEEAALADATSARAADGGGDARRVGGALDPDAVDGVRVVGGVRTINGCCSGLAARPDAPAACARRARAPRRRELGGRSRVESPPVREVRSSSKQRGLPRRQGASPRPSTRRRTRDRRPATALCPPDAMPMAVARALAPLSGRPGLSARAKIHRRVARASLARDADAPSPPPSAGGSATQWALIADIDVRPARLGRCP